jgi:hypothetical protein
MPNGRPGFMLELIATEFGVEKVALLNFEWVDAVPAETLGARGMASNHSPTSAGGDCSRGRVALVKPGLPATASGGKGLTRASAPAPVPPYVRRQGGAGSLDLHHSFFKRGEKVHDRQLDDADEVRNV